MRILRLSKVVTALIVFPLLPSCMLLQPQIPNTVVENKYANNSAVEVLGKLRLAYSDAKKSGLEFFAPNQYRQGKQALLKAAGLHRSKAPDIEVLKHLYIAEQQLEKSQKVKVAAEAKLPEVFNAIQLLKEKRIKHSYDNEFGDALYKTRKLLGQIEDDVLGKPVTAAARQSFEKQKQALIKELQVLEIKVVKYNALNDSIVVFKEAQKIDAESLAPKTYQQAEQALKEANSIIEKNVKDDTAIKLAADKFKFAAFHALHVARAVDQLDSLGSSQYEDYILDLENKLKSIVDAFQYRDIRNHSLHEQMQVLTGLTIRKMTEKSISVSSPNTSASADNFDYNKLKKRHEQAQQKIKELTQQLSQIQSRSKSAKPTIKTVMSKKEREYRKKATRLEQRVAELVLENNNLKAQRDSLQNKLNNSASK